MVFKRLMVVYVSSGDYKGNSVATSFVANIKYIENENEFLLYSGLLC